MAKRHGFKSVRTGKKIEETFTQQTLDLAFDEVKNEKLSKIAKGAQRLVEEDGNAHMRRIKDGFSVYESEDRNKPIDLKPYFRRSSKTRRNRKGQWYLVVPMRIMTHNPDKPDSAGRMSRRQYTETLSKFKALDSGESRTQTIVSDYLYDNRRPGSSTFTGLNYEPLAKNKGGHKISAEQDPTTGRRKYTAFRTVGAFSKPSSWILNREYATNDNLTENLRKLVREVSKN